MQLLKNNNPKLFAELDVARNKQEFPNLDLNKLSKMTMAKVYWKCPDCGYSYLASVNNRNNKHNTGCPICGKKKHLINENKYYTDKAKNTNTRLQDSHPEIYAELNIERNKKEFPEIDIENISEYSNKKVWWTCKIHGDYLMTVSHRITRNSKCPKCAVISQVETFRKNKAKNGNTLKEKYPKLYAQLNMKLNSRDFPNIDFSIVSYASHIKAWWNCPICGKPFQAIIKNRSLCHSNCKCMSKKSTPELTIFSLVKKYFDNTVKSEEKIAGCEIDICSTKYNIYTEYDGYHYHTDENSIRRENHKNKIMKKLGHILYRIKETTDIEKY